MTLTKAQNRDRMRRQRAADPGDAGGEPGLLGVAVEEALALLPADLLADRPVEVAAVRRLAEQADGDPRAPRTHLLVRELNSAIARLRMVAHMDYYE